MELLFNNHINYNYKKGILKFQNIYEYRKKIKMKHFKQM